MIESNRHNPQPLSTTTPGIETHVRSQPSYCPLSVEPGLGALVGLVPEVSADPLDHRHGGPCHPSDPKHVNARRAHLADSEVAETIDGDAVPNPCSFSDGTESLGDSMAIPRMLVPWLSENRLAPCAMQRLSGFGAPDGRQMDGAGCIPSRARRVGVCTLLPRWPSPVCKSRQSRTGPACADDPD